jgi:hypothetical protein
VLAYRTAGMFFFRDQGASPGSGLVFDLQDSFEVKGWFAFRQHRLPGSASLNFLSSWDEGVIAKYTNCVRDSFTDGFIGSEMSVQLRAEGFKVGITTTFRACLSPMKMSTYAVKVGSTFPDPPQTSVIERTGSVFSILGLVRYRFVGFFV